MKWYAVILIVLCCRLDAYCQVQKRSGSLTQDTVYLRKLLDSAKTFRHKDTASHTAIVEQSLQLAQQINSKQFIVLACFEKLVHVRPETAIKLLTATLPTAKETKDTGLIASAYNYLGYNYKRLKQDMQALDCFFETLKLLSHKTSSRDLEFALSHIGNIYMVLDDPRGLVYQQRCFDLISKRVGTDSVKLNIHLTNLAVANYAFGDTAKAIDLTEKCLSVSLKNHAVRKHAISALHNLTLMYSKWSDAGLAKVGLDIDDVWIKVKTYTDQAFAFAAEKKLDIPKSDFYTNLAHVLLRKKQYEESLNYYLKAIKIDDERGYYLEKRAYFDEISQAYAALGKYDSAFKYNKEFLARKESMTNQENKRIAERKQAEFEFSKVKDSLQFAEQLASEQLKQQHVIAVQQSQELKLKQALLELNMQQSKLAQLGLQKANAELLVNQQLVREKQKQLTLAEKEKALQSSEAALKRTELLAATKELQTQKRMQSFYLVGSVLVLLFLLALFRNYKNRQKAKAQIAAEKLKTQKAEAVRKMAEFEMHGLRAQLNPHFMFNSLNAIQAQILREDTENAGSYLNTFAKMLRQLLENAEYSFVSLNKELEFLKLYLCMEQLRIRDLQFDMDIDPAIDTEHTMIPNMILQPYLENAIWHGLSPKEGNKYIKINILHLSEGISILITDNGIGRKKAAELQSRYRKAHKSKGMELLRKRFDLISAEFGSAIKIDIKDLQERGIDTGTSVHLLIPHSFSEPMMMARETVFNN